MLQHKGVYARHHDCKPLNVSLHATKQPNFNQTEARICVEVSVMRWGGGFMLTQNCADLIGQDGVGVVQPSASTQALSEAVQDGLV